MTFGRNSPFSNRHHCEPPSTNTATHRCVGPTRESQQTEPQFMARRLRCRKTKQLQCDSSSNLEIFLPKQNQTVICPVAGNGRTMFGRTINRKDNYFLSFCPHRSATYSDDSEQRHGLSAMTAKKSTHRCHTRHKHIWLRPEGPRWVFRVFRGYRVQRTIRSYCTFSPALWSLVPQWRGPASCS